MAGYRKLGRSTAHRMMMFRNQTTDLLKNGNIITTEKKAKELERFVAKMITLAKKGDLHSRRTAAKYIVDKTVLQDLFDNIASQYEDRNGGYTRIYKLGPRRGDASMMVKIELV